MQRLTEINNAVENVRSEQAEMKLDVVALKASADTSKEEKAKHAKTWGAIGGVVSSLLFLFIGKCVDYFTKH